MTFRQPYGVCAGVIPWNVPVITTVMKVAPAVAAGNCIIIKTSEKAPLSPLIFAQCAKEAGFPPGVIQIINGHGHAGAALASHMDIRKISFTGSMRTGKIISEVCPPCTGLTAARGKVKLEEGHVGTWREISYHRLPRREPRENNSKSCVWVHVELWTGLYLHEQSVCA